MEGKGEKEIAAHDLQPFSPSSASILTLALRIYFGPVPLCPGTRMPCLHEENSFPLPRA